MSGDSTKDWAEAHWAPLTGENTELTQFNIWHHRRFGFVDHRDAACGSRWLVWTASREALVIELPDADGLNREHMLVQGFIEGVAHTRVAIEAAGLKVKP
ncbi:hypothetical protein JC795_28975 [Pseudomonas veronii]|uniref:hypothetical protein n=1 Tax=Pseudomonas veronii TaxID=76761 RepID=UPI0018E74693|nr:hypothetical protein [Pseudomonas veronii]MBJ2182220.1 hypothetical protein [Pseudomonas veronii]